MKSHLVKYGLLLGVICFTFSCKQAYNTANQFMNSFGFEKLVKRFEGPERDVYQQPQKVLNYIGNVKGQKIMDIGAGTGYFTFKLVDAGAKMIAADVDDRFLNFIKEKMDSLSFSSEQIELRKVPYDDPLLKNGEVDQVLIVNTYHHIEDRSAYFSKVKKGLKPGGRLIVIDFIKKDLPIGPPIKHKVSTDEVIEELKISGFENFTVESSLLEYQYIVVAE